MNLKLKSTRDATGRSVNSADAADAGWQASDEVPSLLSQFWRIFPSVVKVGTVISVILLVAGFSSYRFDIDMQNLMRDPNSVFEAPFYIGILSNFGVLLWTSAGVLCLFVGSYASSQRQGVVAGFLWSAGLLSLILAADDLLQLHELVIPQRLGVSEVVVYAVYAVYGVWFVWLYRRVLLTSEYLLFMLAVGLGAFSTVVDKLPFTMPLHTTIEEGTKLFSIAFWLTFFWRFGISYLRGTIDKSRGPDLIASGSPAPGSP